MSDLRFLGVVRTSRPAFRIRERLDGETFEISFRSITRIKRVSVRLYAADGSPLVSGLLLSLGVSIFEPWRGRPGYPRGQVWVEPLGGDGTEPISMDDLRSRCRVVYRPAADVASAAGTSRAVY